jgi:MarR family transcriptional regulator, 2-MHQ and catechol-resistance regulon repressor
MGTQFKGRASEVEALDAYIKLVRASSSVTSRVHAHLKQWHLTVGQFGVLDALSHLGSLSQGELAKKHLMSNANITMVVDNLEKRGLVRRERQPDDRRIVKVHLTDAGRNLFRQVFSTHVSQIEEAMSILTREEQRDLGRLCRKVGLTKPDSNAHDDEAPQRRTVT